MAKAVEPPDVAIVEVAEPFVCPLGSFTRGQLFRIDDPVVLKYPSAFRPARIESTVRRAEPRVEQATAAPGEKRGA